MTPLRFEELYRDEWDELERAVDHAFGRTKAKRNKKVRVKGEPTEKPPAPIRGERVAALYRRACEHLALARARSYPAYMLDRLDRLTVDAHQLIYQRRELGFGALKRIVTLDFPRAVREHAAYVWLSAALFGVPLVVVGLLVYFRPELILTVVDGATASDFEQMYSEAADAIGRSRTADTDWAMFGGYIRHNIGIAFQCFAGGLFAGLGTIFYLIFNGAVIGAVAGYVTERGLGPTFYSFVVTHGAFELTAIVLSGAAGLRLGHSLVAPGRRSRMQSLVAAGRDCAVLLYGVTAMLVVAAAIEAFWSSARWMPHAVKYSVAALCWLAVLGYLAWQGRRAS
jgi:uncharacterized membrane protein SpoIIM required for sporulation